METSLVHVGLFVAIFLAISSGAVTEEEGSPEVSYVPLRPDEASHHEQEVLAADAIPLGIEPHIIGGTKAEPGQFPWQVAIIGMYNGESLFCGGSLIDPGWVLTAGHCIPSPNFFQSISCMFWNLFDIGKWGQCWYRTFTISLGSNSLDENDPDRVVLKSTDIVRHQGYRSVDLNNDIGLIKLPQKVNLTAKIKTIALAEGAIGVNQSVVISGWGKTNDASNSVSLSLNFVILNTISNSDCKKYFAGTVVKDNIFCAKGSMKQNSCNGDSGGPAVIYTGDKVAQVGIVSFVSSTGCETNYPSGYVRVDSFEDWIRRTAGI